MEENVKRKKIAVITGASSGFGKEFCKLLSRESNVEEIWAIARDKQKLEKLKKQIKGKVLIISLDLSKVENVLEFQTRLEEENPSISYLVNSAGYGKFASYEDLNIMDSVNMVELNCNTVVAMGLACIPYMKKGAHIINVASQASFQPLPYLNIYSATKAFVRNYSRALNVELKGKQISVTAVCPGWMDTAFLERAKTESKKSVNKFGGMVTADKVAKKALEDAKKSKDISVYSFYIKLCHVIAKILPQKTMMQLWMWQQKIF